MRALQLAALALAALALAAGRVAAQAGCQPVAFSVDPARSALQEGGKVTAPLTADFLPAAPEAAVGLVGRLALLAPGGEPLCLPPGGADAAGLAAALAGAALATQNSTGGALRVYPEIVMLKNQLASVNWTRWALDARIVLGPPAAPAALESTIAGGFVRTKTIVDAEPYVVEVLGVKANQPAAAAAEVAAAGNSLNVTLRGVALTFTSVNGATGGVADYTLAGDLALTATLGCAGGCSGRGACAAAPGGGAPRCACDCGWAGDACELPSGLCPASYPSLIDGSAELECAPSGGAGAGGGAAGPTCEVRYEGDPTDPTSWKNAVIAAVPLAFLVGFAAALATAARAALAGTAYDPDAAAAEGLKGGGGAAANGAAAGAAADPEAGAPRAAGGVQQLSWAGLTCETRPAAWSCVSQLRGAAPPPVKEGGLAAAAATPLGPGGGRLVLRGVSGTARRGELVGLLGPSGSGKTTLLAALAGSAGDLPSDCKLRGAVLLDGAPLGAAGGGARLAYVPQDDSLVGTLTVEECLRYSALLRLPAAAGGGGAGRAGAVRAAVDAAMAELGLTRVAASRVGGTGAGDGHRGVSGGERRRVAIGMELVTDPAVLLLDEPTSGLDSYSALKLAGALTRLARRGRVVLASLHQPSPALFASLDRAYLLAAGRCVYFGPPAGVPGWAAAAGAPVPPGAAPAEHMLQLVCDPATLPAALAAADAADAGAAGGCGDSDAAPPSSSADEDGGEPRKGAPPKVAPPPPRRWDTLARRTWARAPARAAAAAGAPAGPPLWRQLGVLAWRTGLDLVRNPFLVVLHWGAALACGLFVGCIFFDVQNDIAGAQNRAGAIFFALCFFGFTSLTTVDLVAHERPLVAREVRGGYYHPAAYAAAKAALDGLALRAAPAALYAAVFYPMAGFQPGSIHVAVFVLGLIAYALAVGAASLAAAVGARTAGRAALAMNLALLGALLMGGFLANVGDCSGGFSTADSGALAASGGGDAVGGRTCVPAWIRWLHWLSPIYYGFAALATNELSTLSLDLAVRDLPPVLGVRGNFFLGVLGVDLNDLTLDVSVLVGMYFGLLLVALAAARWRVRGARRVGAPAA